MSNKRRHSPVGLLIWIICIGWLPNTGHSSEGIPLSKQNTTVTSLTLPKPVERATHEIPISGPWRLVQSTPKYRIWKVPMPVRTRTLFFHRPPGDMAVIHRKNETDNWANATELIHIERPMTKYKGYSWAFSKNALFIRRSAQLGPPKAWEYAMRDSQASKREQALMGTNLTDNDRVFRSIQIGDLTKQGLFLPAPSTIDFTFIVPENGRFGGDLTLVPPEAADPAQRSDGASLSIAKIESGKPIELLNTAATLGKYKNLRIDLSNDANKEITLRFKTHPGEDSNWDYVFLADPIVYTPQEKPKRIVMIFIDTLRQDAMSMYGYSRKTTPKLDQWASTASVFESARSVAPWTLPAAKTITTGFMPDRSNGKKTLQDALGDKGWATGFIAGNVYLSSTFEMHRDWSEHRCVNWPNADYQIKQAKRFLKKNDDRPALLMLHLMDMHLPYTEPENYRNLFAGPRPAEFLSDSFLRPEVLKAANGKNAARIKQHVRDRYDNNLRYLDDVLSSFIETLNEEDVVAIFSDHGEEFWEHGGFEHGHTFFDELLKVPLIIKSPDLQKGRIHEPVSLIDLAPTLAKSANASLPKTNGIALQNLENQSRTLSFGSPLYGPEGWGVHFQDQKYIARAGKESLYNLKNDPDELSNLSQNSHDMRQGREALSKALQTPVRMGYRIALNTGRHTEPAEVDLKLNHNIEYAWQGADPKQASILKVAHQANAMTAVETENKRGSAEIFVLPTEESMDKTQIIELLLRLNGQQTVAIGNNPIQAPAPNIPLMGKTLFKALTLSRAIKLTHAILPVPFHNLRIKATNDEVRAELKALGYMD